MYGPFRDASTSAAELIRTAKHRRHPVGTVHLDDPPRRVDRLARFVHPERRPGGPAEDRGRGGPVEEALRDANDRPKARLRLEEPSAEPGPTAIEPDVTVDEDDLGKRREPGEDGEDARELPPVEHSRNIGGDLGDRQGGLLRGQRRVPAVEGDDRRGRAGSHVLVLHVDTSEPHGEASSHRVSHACRFGLTRRALSQMVPRVGPYASYIVQTLVTLLAVCTLAFLVLYGARRLGVGRPRGPIELVGLLPLDARRSIYLVKVAGQVIVVGASEAGFTKLGELPADEVPVPTPEATAGFADVLARVLGRGSPPASAGSKDGSRDNGDARRG
jgi:flagellar protein FliO/FliZ